MKIAILQTNLGNFDKPKPIEQGLAFDHHLFTDENFSPRTKSMTPRLQAKIPKCFGWQLVPDYDYYLWIDGNISLRPDALEFFQKNCEDVVVFQHPQRNTIYWEYRYNYRGLHNNAPSNYLTKRYTNELLDEQYEVIKNDPDYKDDLLVLGGLFMYRNTVQVQEMLKEWWYNMSRYCVSDQLAWAYVLKKSGLRVKVLPDIEEWADIGRHKK